MRRPLCASQPPATNHQLITKSARSSHSSAKLCRCQAINGSAGDQWRRPLDTSQSSIVALGKFDALHTGHRTLAVQASCMGSRPWLISFSGMAEVMGWPKRPPLVAPLDRTRVLQTWASHCNGTAPGEHLVPFSAVRNMSPEQFVQLLAEDLQVKGVVVGKGFRFGFKAAGDTSALQRLGAHFGLTIEVVDLLHLAASSSGGPVSSSKVREALAEGHVTKVAEYLGRPYCLVASMSWPDLQQHRGNALGGSYLRRVPMSSFDNQRPGKGIYQARIGLNPQPRAGGDRPLALQSVVVVITEFGADIVLPAKILTPDQETSVHVFMEFDKKLG